jgi:hypothetical protein
LQPRYLCESVENIEERAQRLKLLGVANLLEYDSLMFDDVFVMESEIDFFGHTAPKDFSCYSLLAESSN